MPLTLRSPRARLHPLLRKQTTPGYPKALKASMQGAFGKESGEWGQWYKEFTDAGGRVYFNQVENVAQLKTRIEKAMAMKAAKPTDVRLRAKRVLFAVRDNIEAVNMGVENAVRLATFRAAREAGLSKDRAASLAKNVTVNFNRRGTFGPAMNAAYLFYNASMQGTVRILSALRSRKVQAMMAGVMTTGFLLEMLNAMLTGDDDDGETYYDKISDFDKSRNLILMLGDEGRYLRIPLPYGYNVFFNAGRTVAEIGRRGGNRWQESAGNLISSALDAFNPIGGNDSILNFLSPTLFDPVVDLERNRDFTDKPIMPDQPAYAPPEADHSRFWPSVAPHWKAVTDYLNNATGGNEVEPGMIDVSPETLEYLAGTVLGAAGAFADRVASMPAKATSDEGLNINDVPLARKIVGAKPAWYDKSAYHERVDQVQQAVKYSKDYLEIGQEDAARDYVTRNRDVLLLEKPMKRAEKEMRKIRKERKGLEKAKRLGQIDAATYAEGSKTLKDAEKQVIGWFNSQWNEVMLPASDSGGE